MYIRFPVTKQNVPFNHRLEMTWKNLIPLAGPRQFTRMIRFSVTPVILFFFRKSSETALNVARTVIIY